MKDNNIFDVVLLFALPASGKSEVRHLLSNVEPDRLVREFHIGENVQLDDFPYVYMMRCVDEELTKLGEKPLFADKPGSVFKDDRFFGALIRMLNEDYEDLFTRKQIETDNVAKYFLDRFDQACRDCDIDIRVDTLPEEVREKVYVGMTPLCTQMLKDKYDNYPDTMEGKTCVIEMARGGDINSTLPLTGSEGYQYSLRQFSDHILSDAAILYIWVTPEESRRKNHDRAVPGEDGSSLFHETPIEVMYHTYGVCDMMWLREHSEKPDTITVKEHGKTYHVPIGVFDNRVDKTTPFRSEPETWDPQLVDEAITAIKEATDTMWDNYK